MNELSDREVRARKRYIILNLVNFAAVAVALFGVGFASGRLRIGDAAANEGEIVGFVLMGVGVAAFFFLPNRIRRHWRAQDEQR